MNDYQISYSQTERVDGKLRSRRVVVANAVSARNGIEAIYKVLRVKFAGQQDLIDALENEARTIGSIKRLTLAGITFQADKVA